MDRLLMKDLVAWRNRPKRKPLILRGVRQVGKTWLLREFGKSYFADVCYVNFERNSQISSVFENSLNPNQIITSLALFHGKPIIPEDTLIIFDEIQEVPRALTSLKYFAEEAPEYYLCCAGSQLGYTLHEHTSFPVGKVEYLDLRPLSFYEFLMANGQGMLADSILNGNFDLMPFEYELISLLKTYFVVGGMPASVQTWIDTHDYNAVDTVLDNLSSSYIDDFAKHAPHSLSEKLRYVWQSIPSQLAKENKKFIFGLVREGARAREYEETLMWLKDMGLIHRCGCITKPALPLRAYEDLKAFKVFLMDVGVLRHLSGLSPAVLLEGSRVFEEFKGALTEQFVLQELLLLPSLNAGHYWTSSGKAEIDFVFSFGLNVFPLEVKAEMNVKAKSMKVYDNLYHPERLFITSLRPYNTKERLTFIPLYMLFALEYILKQPSESKS